ncbi:hypothetical protein FFLO_00501 [Filobasidium floriforme]|uniref:Uncharacterized protein n=1 Tax=Filobasidium floriforme TaxID=5210 RepID=A0A8K0JR88_9TREE|nr:hypothetical protein FFLO_00501 [Filobasidium floriforme]
MARSDLPQLQTNLDRVIEKGSLASSFATLTPVDDDAPRESFDFTGEYAQLNENGCRQSFLAELDRLGLVIDETDNIPEAKGAKEIQPTITKRSSLNRDFKFGRPAPAPLERAQSAIPSGGIPFVPRHSQHLPDDSLFSFASMSSVGRVVDTGISGNFVNLFEREFAAAQNPRPTQLHSAHKSWTDSLRSSVGRSRGSIDSIDSALENTRGSRHRRKNSSVDSAHSAMRRIGRPGVDSDRMFKTNCLYSIAGSPSNSQASPSEAKTLGKGSVRGPGNAKPSYDTLLDYKPSGSKLDSLYDQTRQSTISQGDDSLFSTSSRNQSFSLFRPRPISCISDRSEVDSSSQDASPLARKSGEMLRRSQDVERRGGHDRQQSTVDQSRSSRTLEAIGDDSFTSIESTNKPLPPRNSFSRSIQARLSSTPRLISPSGSEPSSKPSTDVQSIISAMLDPPVTKPMREPKVRTASQVESGIQAQDDRRNGWEKRETMDSLVSKYTSGSSRDSMKRWVDWQREAELEIEKSKMAWADTDASRAVVDKFKPPSNLEDVARLIQISRYVNTPLAEASPGKQIARRAQVPMDAFDKAIAESAVQPPQHRPAALPTKFQRTDTAGTIASITGSITPSTPSGLFSFAMTQPVRESPVRLPLVDTSNVHGTSPSRRSPRKSLTKKNTKTIGPVRSRVTSTASARRAKLGWGRRRDSATAPVPKVSGPRTPSKRSSGEDDERRQDNGPLLDDRRRSGYKARNSLNRRSIRA